MPLGVTWKKITADENDISRALAAIRRGPREGTLLDFAADPDFITLLLRNVIQSRTIETDGKKLEFRPTAKFQERDFVELEKIRPISGEQSNSTALVDEDYVVKVFRRAQHGFNPEIEIGRFLTDEVEFANAPVLYGSVELVEGDNRTSVAVVHAFVENQGDAWTVTNAYLDRFMDAQRLLSSNEPAAANELSAYLLRVRQIGKQVARLHLALASRDNLVDFIPEPISHDDIAGWIEGVLAQARATFGELKRRSGELREQDRDLVASLLEYEPQLNHRVRELLAGDVDAMKIRLHGDLHLGQMLWVKDDVFVLDFEGEPRRTIAERRRKAPAARDVAGVIRSIDYSTTAALDRAIQLSPDEGGQLATALNSWREQSSLAFWEAYQENLSDSQLWPTGRHQSNCLLDFFLLEKAIYEIGYELANRPDWLRVPLEGTIRILAGQPEQTPPQDDESS
jgi:maltose alpha-D-glucosyltransferase/alpha-amylase